MSVAIVTGASRGFGRALALDLAKDGWSLVVDARQAPALQELEMVLRPLGTALRSIVGDVTDPGHRQQLVEAALELGGLDLLVNNASSLGVSPLPKLDRYPLQPLRQLYEVNVIAPLALLQLSLPLLQASGGIVVELSSDAAIAGYERWGGYGSSKAALDQLHNVFAHEQPELRVYQFDPGDMRTEMHQEAFPGEDISDRPEPEEVVPALRRLLHSQCPSGRYRAAEWMAS